MDLLKTWNEKIWDTGFWLPEGSSWGELYHYTRIDFKQMILSSCIFATFIYAIRLLFERYIAQPIGVYFKIPGKLPFTPNTTLEAYYGEKKIIHDSIIMLISKDTGIEYDLVKNWFAARKMMNKPSQLEKFSESAWRFTFYLLVWFLGIFIIHDKAWLKDTHQCWVNYPRQYITDDVYAYYIIEIGFYLSLLFSQFSDVKRKDFWQMFLHHIITLSLLIFSLLCNFQRVGSLIIVLHDTADSSLELAKLGKYARNKWISDPFFGVFTVTWFVTRLYIYPKIILYSTIYEAVEHLQEFPAFHYFNCLLCLLLAMHIVWFSMILRVVYKVVFMGIVEDTRSESNSSNEHEHKD